MVGPHSLEVVMHVAELADVAWSARERHLEHALLEKEEELEHEKVEDSLESVRSENKKLRAALLSYKDALQKEIERQGGGQTFDESLDIHRDCTVDLYDQLKMRLESPAFLQELNEIPPVDDDSKAVMNNEDSFLENASSEDPDAWLLVDDNDVFGPDTKENKEGLGSEGYVIINQEDFVDSMASFLAKYVSSMPQAKQMTSKELQKTILKAFNQAEKKGVMRKLWETSKLLYTATSWGVSVFGLYRHPIIVRAASMAIWTSCTLILTLLK